MGIDFNKHFNELFGGDDEEAFASSPSLGDVAPDLVDSSGSSFSSKELNPRRHAVSARNFRNPRVRSAENAFKRQGAVEQVPSSGRRSSIPSGQSQPPPYGLGSPDVNVGDSDSGDDAIGETIGNSLAGMIGGGLASTAALGTATGLALGAPLGMSANFGLESAMGSLVTPTGMLGLANLVGGGIQSGNIANTVMGPISGQIEGSPMSMFGDDIATATTNAALNPGGLVGLGIQEATGRMGLGLTPSDEASAAAHETMGTAQTMAQFSDMTTGLEEGDLVSNQQAPQQSARNVMAETSNQVNQNATSSSTNQGDPVSGNFGQAGLGNTGVGGMSSGNVGAPTGRGNNAMGSLQGGGRDGGSSGSGIGGGISSGNTGAPTGRGDAAMGGGGAGVK
jgi:hypothetical protein